MFIGLLFILIGIMLLLNKLGVVPGEFSDYIVPIALVALGASFIFKDKKEKN